MNAEQRTAEDELISAFEAGKVEGADFPHEHHVRVAWGLARRYGREDGLRRMIAGIRDMGARAGRPEAYHETITRAWFELIADAKDLDGDSVLFDRGLLSRYYSPGRLRDGRQRWVEPDLHPLGLPAPDQAQPELLHAVLRRVPTAVGVVAAHDDGAVHAATVSSITSVSRMPPLVSVCLSTRSRMLTLIRRAPTFSISVLAAKQSELADHFAAADRGDGTAQFTGVSHQLGSFGPVIDQATAWIGCRRHALYECGDHHIVLGLVGEAIAGADGPALVRQDGTYL
jgi:3-hydroxy-9,10-secoandrosta-1,3,5(10)-triene-9,17-dione monooxygenase reductase component